MTRRVTRGVVVALVLALVALCVPSSAMAASDFFVPCDWVTMVSGTCVDAANAFGGPSGAGVAVTGGSDPLTINPDPAPETVTWHVDGVVFDPSGVSSGNAPFWVEIDWHEVTTQGYTYGILIEAAPVVVCTNGQTVGSSKWSDGWTTQPDGRSVYGWDPVAVTQTCGSTSDVTQIQTNPSTSSTFTYNTFTYLLGASGQATTTTTLVCRNVVSGLDSPESLTSDPGATVAPAPVCPSGSYPVRETVTNSQTGVVSDASVSTGSLPAMQSYYQDPSSVVWVWYRNGVMCQVGDPVCASLITGGFGSLTTDQQAQISCYMGPANDPTMALWSGSPQSTTDCSSASSAGKLAPAQTNSSGDSSSADTGSVIRAIQGAAQSIVGAVKSSAASIVSGMGAMLLPDTTALTNDWNRVDAAAHGDGAGSNGGSSATGQWVQAAHDVGSAFADTGTGDCAGPEFDVKPPKYVYHPFNVCTEPGKTISQVAQWATLGALGIVGLRVSMRLLWSSFGLYVSTGAAGGSD